MDLVISGGEDSLLESLSFDLPPSSSYIQTKRYVSYYPSGASTYSPSGVRVMRFNIVGEGWLDPESLRITGKLTNVLQLADGPHSMIQRAKLSIAGTVCEDLDQYNRNHQLFRRICMPKAWCENDACESGLQRYQEGAPNTNSPSIVEEQLASGKYAQFNFAPLFRIVQLWEASPSAPVWGYHHRADPRRRRCGRDRRVLYELRATGDEHPMQRCEAR